MYVIQRQRNEREEEEEVKIKIWNLNVVKKNLTL